ncbi:MAG: hypothetical protein EZS28_001663 [Streblomastix strix]|uniref:Uncharacterized protein n=1 Tax=Streblomastix strix TaxID=222440 RepID=A0A5J4X6K2_9EUKA|nr:MAG: hypothetical protein EZS28_001663 [Streblomastix strix]
MRFASESNSFYESNEYEQFSISNYIGQIGQQPAEDIASPFHISTSPTISEPFGYWHLWDYNNDVVRKLCIQQEEKDTKARNIQNFEKPIQHLVQQIFSQTSTNQSCKSHDDHQIVNKVVDLSLALLEKAATNRSELLDRGRNTAEIVAAAVFDALIMTDIDVKDMMSSLTQKKRYMSDCRAFQKFVDITEVVYRASLHEYNSASVGINIRASSRCIDNVVNFLQLCDELVRNYLHSEDCIYLDQGKICLEYILGIERCYSEACTNATKIFMLMLTDIWGREWHPELGVSSQKKKNSKQENNRKRTRRDESDDEDVEIFGIQQASNLNILNINETAEISVEQLRNNIKEIIYEQLEDLDEQSFHQNENSSNELIKTYNDEDFNSYNHSTASQMMIDEPKQRKEEHKYQEQSKKVKNGSKKRITLFHAPLPRITDIDNVSETSPLSQPFANENTILPFYIICREEELCEATQNVIQQQTSITDDDEKEIGNKRKIRKGTFRERSKKKLEESIQSFVYDQIFGKKGTCKYGNEYSILDEDEQQDNNASDLLSWCFQVSDNINMIPALTEEEERRVTHEVWKMPNFESEVFSEVKESVINELQELTPIKANSADIAFQARTRTEGKRIEGKRIEGKRIEGKRIEGTGAMPLNLSRDVLSFANNVSGQHIEDLRKQIFLSKSQLFKNEDVSWCLNPFGIQDRKSSRKGKEVKCNDESDNYEYKMEKVKRKRDD